MGGIINFFKNLMGGIFGFIGGVFGGKKSSNGFFMELDESAAAPAPASVAKAAVAQQPKAKATVAQQPKAKAAVAQQPKAAAISVEPATPVVAPPAVNPLNLPQPTVSFAEANQLPLPTPRRRPGANMSSYLNMAKSVNR